MNSLFWIYMVINTGTLFFGVLYLSKMRLMPYHEEVIQMKWEELQPEMQFLLKAFIGGIGASFTMIAFLNYAIILIPFRRGEFWAALVIPIMGIAYYVAGLIVPQYLHKKTGAKTPRLPPAIAIVVYLGCLVFSVMHYY